MGLRAAGGYVKPGPNATGRLVRRSKAARAAPSAAPLTALERLIADAVAVRASGEPLNPWTLPIVVACRDLLADTVAQLPMVAYRGRVPRPDQPAIVVRPDPSEPRWLSIHRLVNNLTGWGYVWLVPVANYADDWPAAVQVVDADRASPRFDPAGRMTSVWYDGRELTPGPDGIIWVPWRVTRAGTPGESPIHGCWRAIEHYAALFDMAGSFWEAGFPSVAVMVKQGLNPVQIAELKTQVLGAWARKHEPAVIDRDGRLEPVGSSAVESQLVESMAVADAQVARAFGVAPSLVNVAAGDSLTYSTTEAEFSRWLKLGLGAYLMRIEAGFTDLVPYGTNVRFDTAELLRTDWVGRMTGYAQGIAAGIFSAAEVRDREGMPTAGAGPSTVLADPPETVPRTGEIMNRNRTVARAATMTPPAARTVVARRAAVEAADDAAMTLDVCLVPWGETARVTDDGRRFYDETWTPGSLVPSDLVAVFDGHRPTPSGVQRGDVIGRAAAVDDRPDGLHASLTLADTARGRDVYALARTLGVVHVSIEADVPTAEGEAIVRSSDEPGMLTGVAIQWPPNGGAFAGAVGAARSNVEPDADADDDDDDDDTTDDDTPPADDTTARARVAELVRTEVARFNLGRRSSGVGAGPFARYQSFDQLHAAVRSLPPSEAATVSRAFADAYTAHRVAARAWTNQITTDNPGIVPPSWLSEVFGIVDRGRPSITALGGPRSPGDTGLDVHWPYYDGDLTTIVAVQTAEKTDINSVKVSFKRGQATLATYAGGSDVSYQLQRRSSPGYMALYDRILQIAYGITTENAFIDAVVAGAGHTLVLAPTTAAPPEIKAFLFGASAHVRAVTGAPATAVLVASDVFQAWGALDNLFPAAYGTQNVAGTAQASNLSINISGLEVTEAPMAPAGTVVVTNEQAASWLEEGPFLATGEDVQKLGTDVAIWGMGVPGLFLPAGITKAAAVAGDPQSRGRK